ncbi:hypothetical protein Q5705_02160 [Kosakonia sp. H02]|nr:hypothetical protein Q5705_02160 [Kosakonia sp. H02]
MHSSTALTTTRAQSVASFRNNIDSLLQRLNDEFQQSKNIADKAEAFTQRGFFSRWSGSLTAKNDTDLAEMIGSLGGSLNVTQEVVQCLLQISSEKNQVIKGFHAAIVDKLRDLESNDTTLDFNVRENFTLLLQHLKEQVEDKLEQANAVEEHTAQLAEQSETLAAIRRDLQAQITHSGRVTEQVSALEQTTDKQSDELAALKETATSIHATLSTLEHQLAEASLQHKALFEAYQQHCNDVEHAQQRQQESVALLARTMRKNRINTRDILLFATTAAVGLLFWLHFAPLMH